MAEDAVTHADSKIVPPSAGLGLRPRYSIAYFEQWRESCRVRRCQEAYTKLVAEAKAKGVSTEDELARQGFADYHAFCLSCPRFGLLCWPADMAELGSGVVLYFHFLAFLMLLLASVFIFQIYPMAFYAGFDRLRRWPAESGCPRTFAWFAALTPGSLGPSYADDVGVPVNYFLVMILLAAAIILKSAYQKLVDCQVDANTVQPNDFALLVEGLPVTATDEAQLASWFQDNLIAGKKAEVVKVVIGWNVAEYRTRMAELKSITEQLQNIDPVEQQEEHKKLLQAAAKIRKDMMSSAPSAASRLTSSGVVVVVLRHQEQLRECVARWDTVVARWLNREYNGCTAWRGGEALPLYPLGDVPVCQLRICRAPNPQDINWEDLGVPLSTQWTMMLKTNLAMALVVGVSFGVCVLVKLLTGGCEAVITGAFGSILPALAIALANVGVNAAARKFGQYEFHQTKAGEVMSQSLKMGVGMLVNTAGVILAVNAQPRDWYKGGGLIDDLTMLLLILGIVRPVLLWLDLPFYIRKMLPYCGRVFPSMRRRVLTQEMIERWNDVEQRGEPTTKEETKELKKVRAEVDYFKKVVYQPSEMLMTRRYAYAMTMGLCCLYYMPLLPITPLLGILALGMQFVVDKYLIVRWFKRCTVQGREQAAAALQFVKVLACVIYPIAILVFLIASWGEEGQVVTWSIISLLLGLLCVAVPLPVWRRILGLNFLMSRRLKTEAASDCSIKDYYTAQYEWTKDNKYHQAHFLYRHLPAEQNPENLLPDRPTTVSIVDVKEFYGVATTRGAEKAIAEAGGDASSTGDTTPSTTTHSESMTPAARTDKGLDGSSEGDSGDHPGGSEPAPIAYGAPTVSIKVSDGKSPDEDAPPVATLAAATLPKHTTTATPPPVHTTPDTPPPVHTTPDTPPPVHTTPGTPPPVHTIEAAPPLPSKGSEKFVPKVSSPRAAWSEAPAPTTSATSKVSKHSDGTAEKASRTDTKIFERVVPHTSSIATAPPPPAHGPKWERKGDDGSYIPFADDCQAEVEKSYQDFLGGAGPARVQFSTSSVTLSVDFQRMTQLVVQAGKPCGRVRKIQRTEW
mmetsp:Transcript_3273/g.5396  ORF Transcript_3273/g.5396 Transcript_3273/m.5396 type:complete len:1078 (-) Transcript_3273:52-3285(-)